MTYYVRKEIGGVEVWLKRVTPFVAWGPREQAQRFTARHEAVAACRTAGRDQPKGVSIVAEAPNETPLP